MFQQLDSTLVIAPPQLLSPINHALSDSAAMSRPVPVVPVQPRAVVKPVRASLSSADSACLMLKPLSADYLFSSSSSRPYYDRIVASQAIASDYDRSPYAVTQQVTSRPSASHSALANKPLGQAALGADSVWLFMASLLSLSIVGFVHMRFAPFVSQILSLLTSTFNWRSVVDSLKVQRYWASRLIFASSCLLITLALYEIVTATRLDSHISFHGFRLFVALFAAVISYLFGKILFNYLLGFTFDNMESIHHVLISKLLAIDILGVLIAPLVVIIPFVGEDAYPLLCGMMIFVMIIMYIWRLLSSIRIILNDYLSVFYSFLYLCTVELIPIAVIFKITTMIVS